MGYSDENATWIMRDDVEKWYPFRYSISWLGERRAGDEGR